MLVAVPLLIMFGVAALIVGVVLLIVYAVEAEKKRRAAVIAEREQLANRVRGFGWKVITGPMAPPRLGFAELKPRGSDQEVRFYVYAPGTEDAAFEHRYVVQQGSGDHQRSVEIKHSCALLKLPFAAQPLMIDTGASLLKLNTIEIESEAFNKAYRVACRDERFAVTMLDYAFVDALLRPGVVGHIISLEVIGPWMLITLSARPYEELVYLLQWAQRLRDDLPTVMASVYPIPPTVGPYAIPPNLARAASMPYHTARYR